MAADPLDLFRNAFGCQNETVPPLPFDQPFHFRLCWRRSRIIRSAKSMICCHGIWRPRFKPTHLKPPKTHSSSVHHKISGHLVTYSAAPSRAHAYDSVTRKIL